MARRVPATVVATLVSAVAAGVTAGVVWIPQVRFGSRAPDGHIALETAAVLIALLVALLALGRFRRGGTVPDLLLTAAFGVLALVDLVFAAESAVEPDAQSAATWGALGGHVVGAALLAAAAVGPRRPESQRRVSLRRGVWWLLGLTAGGLVAAVGLAANAAALPAPVDPALSPAVGVPGLDANPLLSVVQLVAAGLLAVAAVGYLRRTRSAADPLYAGLGVGAVLAGWSAVNYALFPSLYSDWIYVGDLFRVASYLVFLGAAAQEIRSYWRGQSRVAVLEERQRLARDLHDGLAQELAFIVRHAMRLPEGSAAHRIREAAERALAESRHAIHALSSDDHLLDAAITDAATRSAGRTQIGLDLDLDPTATAEAREREALVRIAAEAVANAGQHAATDEVRILLEAGPPLRLRISDRGRGFDPAADGMFRRGFGLVGMTRRAQGIGADLQVRSRPGEGTVVEVEL